VGFRGWGNFTAYNRLTSGAAGGLRVGKGKGYNHMRAAYAMPSQSRL